MNKLLYLLFKDHNSSTSYIRIFNIYIKLFTSDGSIPQNFYKVNREIKYTIKIIVFFIV